MKECNRCHSEKGFKHFYKDKDSKDGHYSICKQCKNEYFQNSINKERKLEKQRQRRSGFEYKEKYNEWSREYQRNRYKNDSKYKARVNQWNKEWRNKYYSIEINKKKRNERQLKHYMENPELRFNKNERQRKRYKNSDILARQRYNWANNPFVRLSKSVSVSMSHALKQDKNGRHWETLVEYTFKQLKRHLEKQFKDGMSWDNYGKWHIDHIIPISAFSFGRSEDIDFKRCWALKNLRPMWSIDNLRKGSKLEKPFQPYLALAINE